MEPLEQRNLLAVAAPVINFQPLSMLENQALSLSGAGTNLQWDFDYNGVTFDVNDSGPTPIFVSTNIDGPATRTIGLRASDGVGGFSTVTTAIMTINNAAPSPSLVISSTSIAEGTSVLFQGNPGDSLLDTHTFLWTFKNAANVTVATATTRNYTFTPPDSGVYQVRFDATDDDGASGSISTTYTVTNTPPTLRYSGGASATPGSPYTLNLSSTDPGADTIQQWAIDWGDGTAVQTVPGNPSSVTHTYATGPATRVITATATDEDGTYVALSNGVNDGVQADVQFNGGAAVTSNLIDAGTELVVNQADGKVLVAGGTAGHGVLARYQANGALDTNFGTGGSIQLPGTFGTTATGLALDFAGRIVVSTDHFVLRYTASGAPDNGFGRFSPDNSVFVGNMTITTLAIQPPTGVPNDPGGKIIIAGTGQGISANGPSDDMALGRLRSDDNPAFGEIAGDVDGSFGPSGFTYVDTGSGFFGPFDFRKETVNDLAFDSSGNIYAVGTVNRFASAELRDTDLVVAKFLFWGPLDTSFAVGPTFNSFGAIENVNGLIVTDIASLPDNGRSIALDSQGRIVVGGTTGLVRYTASGTLDTTFDSQETNFSDRNNGKIRTSFSAEAVLVDLADRVMAAGTDLSGSGVLTRFSTSGVQSFTGPPASPAPVAGSSFSKMKYDALGRLIVSGQVTSGTDLYLARYRMGTLVNVFGLPASLNIGPDRNVNEGSLQTFSGVITNPGPGTYTWQWTAKNAANAIIAVGSNPTFNFTPPDNGTYTVTAIATSTAGPVTDQALVFAANVNPAPTITLQNGPITEGQVVQLTATSGDPGLDGLQYRWKVFGPSGVQLQDNFANSSFNFQPIVDGNFTVTLTVTDDDGGSGSTQIIIPVSNAPPNPELIVLTDPLREGKKIQFDSEPNDPGRGDFWTYAWTAYRDGFEDPLATGDEKSFEFVPPDDGLYFVEVAVTDDSGATGSTMSELTVENVSPIVRMTGGASTDEGARYTLQLFSADPGDDTITSWTIEWGDGGDPEFVPGNPSSVAHVYADGPHAYNITATAADEDGEYAANTSAAPLVTEFDPSFGNDGQVTAALPYPTPSNALRLLIQPDHKLLAIGSSIFESERLVIARYLPDGSPDTTFDGDGIAVPILDAGFVADAELDSQGRIILSGGFGVARLTPDGQLDATFSDDGIADEYGTPMVMAVDSADRIVFYDNFNAHQIWRLTPAGILDDQFNGGDNVDLGQYFEARDLTVDGQDNVLVTGLLSYDFFVGQLGVARITSAGALDSDFGDGGLVAVGYELPDASGDYRLVEGDFIQWRDGEILVAGLAFDDPHDDVDYRSDLALVRLGEDGSLLNKTLTDIGTIDDRPLAAAPTQDGGILVVGNFGWAKFNQSLEMTWQEAVPALELVYAIQETPDGNVLIAGSLSLYPLTPSIALAQYVPGAAAPEAWELDTSFGVDGDGRDGVVVTSFNVPFSDETSQHVVALAEGGLLVGGVQFSPIGDQPVILRYAANGQLDPDFGLAGVLYVNVEWGHWLSDLAVDAEGRIVALLYNELDGTYLVYRYTSDGSPDETFGLGGIVALPSNVQANALALDGNTIVITGNSADDLALIKLDDAGNFIFDGDGARYYDFTPAGGDPLVESGRQVVVDALGNITVGGTLFNYAAGTFENSANLFIARFLPDGTIDASFGLGTSVNRYGEVIEELPGVVGFDLNEDLLGGLALDSQGRIVAMSASSAWRLNVDGSLDSAFGEGGYSGLNLDALNVAIDSQDRPIFAGFGLTRMTESGELDETFAPDAYFSVGDRYLNNLAIDAQGRIVVVADNFSEETFTDFYVARLIPGEAGVFELAVDVQNVAPAPSAGANQTVVEGTEVTLTAVENDPGVLDTFSYLWQVVASNGQVIEDGSEATFSFTPADDGEYEVTLTVTDSDGAAGSHTIIVTAENTLPEAEILGAPAESDEGTAIALSSSVTDAGLLDTFTYAWSITSPAGDVIATGSAADIEFTPPDNGVYIATLTVTDDDGGISVASVEIQINNVAPITTPLTADTDENASVSVDALDGVSDPGTLDEVQLVELSAAILSATWNFDGSEITLATATISQSGNNLVFDPGVDFDFLAAGETATVLVNYLVGDGEDESLGVLTITVNGNNDAPTVTGAISFSTDEDAGSAAVDLLAGSADVDTAGPLSIVGLTRLDGDDRGITFNGHTLTIDPSAYNDLSVGETVVVHYAFSISDGQGGEVPQSATITIAGRNDAPTVAAPLALTLDEDAAPATLNLLQGAADPDAHDLLSVSSLTLVSGNASGISYANNALTVDPSAYAGLNDGQSAVIVYSYLVNDGHGGTVAQTATITVTGSNDALLVSAGVATYTETDVQVAIAVGSPHGALAYSITNLSRSGGGAINAASGYSIDAAGKFHWTPGAGQLGTYVFAATVADGGRQGIMQFSVTTLGVADGVLTIVATGGADAITIKPTDHDPSVLSVRIDERDFEFSLRPQHNPDNPYLDVDRIRIFALGGADDVSIQNTITISAEIHGGAGADQLHGGEGHDVIFGDSGNDQLWGDAGDDFLVGGSGNDNLKGQNGNDILLAGDLAAGFDASFANLRAISAAWSLLNPYSDLADDNSDGDIVNDAVVDQLNGGKGSDWFLVSSNDITDYNAKKNNDGDKLTQIS